MGPESVISRGTQNPRILLFQYLGVMLTNRLVRRSKNDLKWVIFGPSNRPLFGPLFEVTFWSKNDQILVSKGQISGDPGNHPFLVWRSEVFWSRIGPFLCHFCLWEGLKNTVLRKTRLLNKSPVVSVPFWTFTPFCKPRNKASKEVILRGSSRLTLFGHFWSKNESFWSISRILGWGSDLVLAISWGTKILEGPIFRRVRF